MCVHVSVAYIWGLRGNRMSSWFVPWNWKLLIGLMKPHYRILFTPNKWSFGWFQGGSMQSEQKIIVNGHINGFTLQININNTFVCLAIIFHQKAHSDLR